MQAVHPLLYSTPQEQQLDFQTSFHEEIPPNILCALADREVFSNRVIEIVDEALCSPGYLLMDRVRFLFRMISHPYIHYRDDRFHPMHVLRKLCIIDDELNHEDGLKPILLHTSNDPVLLYGTTHGNEKMPMFVFKKEGNAIEYESYGISENGGPLREFLAYYLDYGHKANVPRTVLMFHQKLGYGSFQEFQEGYSSQRNNLYLRSLSIRNVTEKLFLQIRFIALHQFLTVNVDPNSANLLVHTNNRYEELTVPYLVPIDFSYSLPFAFNRQPSSTFLLDYPVFESVLKMPFSEEEKMWVDQIYSQRFTSIEALDIEQEAIEIARAAFSILREAIQRSTQDQQNGFTKVLTLHDLFVIKHPQNTSQTNPFFAMLDPRSEFSEICTTRKVDQKKRIQACFEKILGKRN